MNPLYSPGNQDSTLYADGCVPNVDLTGILTVSSGMVRDYSNTLDIVLTDALEIDPFKTGVNGLDIGEFSYEKVYGVYVISDLAGRYPPCAVISLNQERPVYPYLKGVIYNTHRLVGYVKSGQSDSGFPPLVQMTTIGEGRGRSAYYSNNDSSLLMIDNASPYPDPLALDISKWAPSKTGVCIKVMVFAFGVVDTLQFIALSGENSFGSLSIPNLFEEMFSYLVTVITPAPDMGLSFVDSSNETTYSFLEGIPTIYFLGSGADVLCSAFCRGFQFSI